MNRELEDEAHYKYSVTESLSLGIARGTNVDHKNHNWIFFDEYMALPFSYLSFAMLDEIDDRPDYFESVSHQFDKEPFDYLFNRQTGIMDSKILN